MGQYIFTYQITLSFGQYILTCIDLYWPILTSGQYKVNTRSICIDLHLPIGGKCLLTLYWPVFTSYLPTPGKAQETIAWCGRPWAKFQQTNAQRDRPGKDVYHAEAGLSVDSNWLRNLTPILDDRRALTTTLHIIM